MVFIKQKLTIFIFENTMPVCISTRSQTGYKNTLFLFPIASNSIWLTLLMLCFLFYIKIQTAVFALDFPPTFKLILGFVILSSSGSAFEEVSDILRVESAFTGDSHCSCICRLDLKPSPSLFCFISKKQSKLKRNLWKSYFHYCGFSTLFV